MLCGMRRFVVVTCTCWLALCNAEVSNTYPLAFGMTPDEAAAAIGSPLTPLVQRRGNEIYEHDIRPQVEADNKGKYIAIDIETGAWEMDNSEMAASDRLPDA